ncbi:amino acid transporter [Bacillus salipaludis]|uniref:Amino acid transporter n=1 Tax=Bacillus salipaludis TaxID=2547811 RepID=A0A4R5VHF3_9BACI|nr:amino acid transporter [Bacillus salipaludis]MDQ6597971.1 amino acid transporter [Bacillus salipaludis]TDK54055.1 amino acid transporter [Bacillus salipaludis]
MKDENKPFNDAIEHFNEIEGNAGNPSNAKINKLPKPLKYFGCFMIGFISLSILLMIILNLLN